MKRRVLFIIILSLPAVLLAGILILTARDLYEIRKINAEVIYQDLQTHLANKTPESFPLPDNISKGGPLKTTVFVFGESSLVLSDGLTFPDYLQRNQPNLNLVNFGVSGVDSFSVRQRVTEALLVRRPDLIILYYGHNDYNNAFAGHIVPSYFEKFGILLGLAYPFHNGSKPDGVILHDEYYWFARLKRPLLFQLAEKLGAIDIRAGEYSAINQLILDHFIRNNEAIMHLAEATGVPLIIMTPVCNLHAEPFGDYQTTTAYYRKGIATRDYQESLKYLKNARDNEILTYDLRAKSGLIDYIRHLKGPNVHVLDLESKLEDMRFGFGYSEFLDYFHFNDGSHRLLADIICDFMEEKNLLGKEMRKENQVIDGEGSYFSTAR